MIVLANRIERDCPNRRYIFERHPRKKLKLQLTEIKEVPAANRTECEDRLVHKIYILLSYIVLRGLPFTFITASQNFSLYFKSFFSLGKQIFWLFNVM